MTDRSPEVAPRPPAFFRMDEDEKVIYMVRYGTVMAKALEYVIVAAKSAIRVMEGITGRLPDEPEFDS